MAILALADKMTIARGINEGGEAFAPAFGKSLIVAGLIDEMNLQRAQHAAVATGDRLDLVLAKLGLLSDTDRVRQLSSLLGFPIATVAEAPDEPVLPDVIQVSFVKKHGVLPLRYENGELIVAVTDPLAHEPLDALTYLLEAHVSPQVMTPADFERAMAVVYSTQHNRGSEVHPTAQATEIDLQRLIDLASEAPIIRVVNQLIGRASELGASDIHLEPRAEALLVRFRVDGMLRTADYIDSNQQPAIISRIKIMAKLDIAERRLPQDGRIKIAIRGVDIDFRVSTVPTIFGESVVMRILDRRQIELDFVKLGFGADVLSPLRKLMHQPNGIVLVTGPTGSGKTTTLYTILKELNRAENKIFTVEDPVEYQLAGINQIQVQSMIGLDFPHALRSILRQDPDIIMIGEIRDIETARIAIQASLTGHLVFATLHTNSAAASISRLLDMGVENYLLASTLKGILAQRLVRLLCLQCAQPDPESSVWIARAPEHLREGKPHFKLSKGCTHCNGTGYRGRSTIAELLLVSPVVQALIHQSATDIDLEKAARAEGMNLLHEDGWAKAWRGQTTCEEVFRVTRAA